MKGVCKELEQEAKELAKRFGITKKRATRLIMKQYFKSKCDNKRKETNDKDEYGWI